MSLAVPERSLLIASTQRSGSTYLCSLIAEVGVAGVPHEFFEAMAETGRPPRPGFFLAGLSKTGLGLRDDPLPTVAPFYSDVRAVADWRAHLGRTFRLGTTPNGVFATKLMWNHLPEMAWHAISMPELAGLSGIALLERLFGQAVWVRVRRRDKVAQAISLWRALQTRTWSSDGPVPIRTTDELQYSFVGIEHMRRRLLADEVGWDGFFEQAGLVPLDLTYEDDIAPDPLGAVARVLAHVRLEEQATLNAHSLLERQSDGVNAAWRTAYDRDLAANGGP